MLRWGAAVCALAALASAPGAASEIDAARRARLSAVNPAERASAAAAVLPYATDAIEAFDLWRDVALGATEPEFRDRALRSALILAVILRQGGGADRLRDVPSSDPEVRLLRVLLSDRPTPASVAQALPRAVLDTRTSELLHQWFLSREVCRGTAMDPLLCSRLAP
jgi:hypothetical protein